MARAALAALLAGLLAVAAAAAQTATDPGATATTATTATTASTASLDIAVEGGGRVVSSPAGIDCPGTCSAPFAEGTSITLTARPGTGDFLRWDGDCAGTGTQCQLTASGEMTVAATFEPGEAAPPPPPPPDGPPPPIVFQPIDKIVEKLPVANIAFNTPTELELGESAVIQLLVSGGRPIKELKAEITELGEREGARIKVSDQVEARLTGIGFEIEAITEERQPVRGSGVTEWRWQIKPTEQGRLRLHLTVAAILDLKGAESTYTIRTFDRTMEIRVTWSDRVSGFFGANWQWLWTTIFVPVGFWLLRSRRKGGTAT